MTTSMTPTAKTEKPISTIFYILIPGAKNYACDCETINMIATTANVYQT